MTHSPFLLRSQQELSRRLFDEITTKEGVDPLPAVTYEENKHSPCLPGPPWDCQNATKAKRDRYILSFVGGIILMAPMVIMVLV